MNIGHFIEWYFRQLEELLMRPGIGQSKIVIGRLLANDFQEFGSSGATFDKRETVQVLKRKSPERLSIQNFRIRVLAPNAVLTTYRSTHTGALGRVKQFLRSSIWRKQDEEWRLVFHQGTQCQLVVET
jgi:hypothetical protein